VAGAHRAALAADAGDIVAGAPELRPAQEVEFCVMITGDFKLIPENIEQEEKFESI
jgi:hypothetical protein